MQAEVLAIGDEITSGQRIDTNSAWLSQRLAEIGIPTMYHTTVADDLAACSQAVETALARADIVVCTGGLGPTADDLTRQAIAAATSRELRLDEPSLAHIRDLFARHGRTMPEQNRVQALFPLGSRVIPNPHGTAPGIDLTWENNGRTSRIFALPGVPAEMMEMWQDSVLPELVPAGRSRPRIHHYRLKCFGLGESALEQRLPDLIRRGRIPSVGITVHKATITLRITAQGDTIDACREQMQSTVQTIHDCLGSIVFGEEDDELEDAVARLLESRGATLATVEFGTAGYSSAVDGRGEPRSGCVQRWDCGWHQGAAAFVSDCGYIVVRGGSRAAGCSRRDGATVVSLRLCLGDCFCKRRTSRMHCRSRWHLRQVSSVSRTRRSAIRTSSRTQCQTGLKCTSFAAVNAVMRLELPKSEVATYNVATSRPLSVEPQYHGDTCIRRLPASSRQGPLRPAPAPMGKSLEARSSATNGRRVNSPQWIRVDFPSTPTSVSSSDQLSGATPTRAWFPF